MATVDDVGVEDSASTFATSDAPYLRYLEQHSLGWSIGDAISRQLRECVDQRQRSIERGTYMLTDTSAVLQILDIHKDRGLKQIASLSLREISNGTEEQARGCVKAVRPILEELRQVPDGVKTRLLLLRTDPCSAQRSLGKHQHTQAPVDLLFAHILGHELRLPALTIARICHFSQDRTGHAAYEAQFDAELSTDAQTALLGTQDLDHGGCMIHFLDQKPFSDNDVDIVIIRCTTSWLERRESLTDMPRREIELSLSASCLHYSRRSAILADLDDHKSTSRRPRGLHMIYDLTQRLRRLDSTIQHPWLQSILWLEHESLLHDLRDLRRRMGISINDPQPSEQHIQLWLDSRMLEVAIGRIIESAAAFQTRLVAHEKDINDDMLQNLERLRTRIVCNLEQAANLADVYIKLRGLEMSNTTILENKAAIALTNIAFIFVPFNLASSIFGMNVQEINSTGTNIWVFVVVAMTMLGLSSIAWMVWKVSTDVVLYRSRFDAVQKSIRVYWASLKTYLSKPYTRWNTTQKRKTELAIDRLTRELDHTKAGAIEAV